MLSNKPQHIALIVPGGVDRSGSERVIPALLALIEQLARRYRVTVVALAPEPAPCSYMLCGARVICLGTARGSHGLLTQLARLLGALRPDPPDIIHAFWLGATSTLALLAGRAFSAPVVASLGGGELVRLPAIGYGGRQGPRSQLHTELALRLAQSLTAGSRYALAPLARRRPDARWVPLGVASISSTVSGLSGLSSKPQLPAPDAPPPLNPFNPLTIDQPLAAARLIHIASLNRVKDQPTLLRAVALAAAQLGHKNLVLDIVGEDTLGGAMQRLADELGLGEVARFHGFLPNATVRAMLASADLHLISSRHESQCVALVEAAMAGVPTVGTAVGLLAELAPAAAWAAPVGDAQALAEGIVALLSDPARRRALGSTVQRWASAHDAAWTAAQFTEIYEEAWYNRQRNAR